MKVGVFHWSFDFFGGGEKVAVDIAKCLGCRKVYTLLSKEFEVDGVKIEDVSYLLPRWTKTISWIARRKKSLTSWLWELIDIRQLDDFDVIVTSGPPVRAIITPEDVMHVCYCHSVPRWLWDLWHLRKKGMKKFILAEIFRWMDIIVDSRVDYYFVNSELIQRRLWKYLKRESVILYPAIEVKKYKFKEYGDFVLHIGRFDIEKNIMPVIKACERANVKLVLVGGKGTDKKTYDFVRKHKSDVIEYRGFVSEDEKLELLATCKAVIYNPISEDFGIVPTEALASGKPVIVNNTGFPPILIRKTGFVRKDGVLEIYQGGIITKGDELTIASAVKLLDSIEWNTDAMREFARKFDMSVFERNLKMWLNIWKKQFDEMLRCSVCRL